VDAGEALSTLASHVRPGLVLFEVDYCGFIVLEGRLEDDIVRWSLQDLKRVQYVHNPLERS